jgi:hypothetical protein
MRFRRSREHYRFREEIRLIPKKVYGVIAILFVIAHIVAQIVLYFGHERPLADPSPLLNGLALAGMVTGGSIFVALLICAVAYVYQDAKRRGMHAGLWAALVAVMLPAYLVIGFIIYFTLREPLPYPCPNCSISVNARFNYCPACKFNLRPNCPNCRHEVAISDHYCANCAYELAHMQS